MTFLIRSIALLVLLSFMTALEASEAQAAQPAFSLSFLFNPVFSTGTPAQPAVYLDVCLDPGCATARPLPLTCVGQNIPTPTGAYALALNSCSLRVSFHRGYPSPDLQLLTNPVSLRIRANNLISQVFTFMGGRASFPETAYRFQVTPAPTGFMVTPRY